MKNGEEIEGTYISSDSNGIQFEGKNGIQNYSGKNILRMDLGFSGGSYCITLKNKEISCDGSLLSVDESNLVIGKGKGGYEKEIIPMKKVLRLELKKSRKTDRLLGIFKKGMEVEIEKNKQIFKGKIKDYRILEKQILVEREGKLEIIFEDELNSLVWKEKPGMFQYSKLFLEYTLPGVHQYKSNKVLGLGTGSLFLVLSAMIPLEFYKAKFAEESNLDYIPVGNNVLVVKGLDYNPEFEQHKKNYYSAIAGLGALYLFHSIYIYREKREGKIPGWNSLELSINKGISHLHYFGNTQQGIGTNIDLKFSYSF